MRLNNCGISLISYFVDMMASGSYLAKPTTLAERKSLLLWVNSIGIEECTQVNSSLSFKNGVLFCLIADYIKGNCNESFLNSVIYDTTDDNASIYNITLAWREIAEIWDEFNLNPEDVYTNEEEVFRFLKILRDLHFIIHNDTADLEEMNRSCAEQVNLTDSVDNTMTIPSHMNINPWSEVRFIKLNDNSSNNHVDNRNVSSNPLRNANLQPCKELYKDIKEELKFNSVKTNQSRDLVLEEPSPEKAINYQSSYHTNILKKESFDSSPLLTRIKNMKSVNTNVLSKAGASSESTKELSNLRSAGGWQKAPTPKNYNFAVNDQISMFSSQDKRVAKNLNTSDIVEYYKENKMQRTPNETIGGDTLQRDMSVYDKHGFSARSQAPLANYHSFNPQIDMYEVKESRDNSNITQADQAFSFDRQNLFSIEDLHLENNLPLAEINKEDEGRKVQTWKSEVVIKPLKLPSTTHNAHKYKNLVSESQKFDANRISADSPMRMLKETQKEKSEIKINLDNELNESVFHNIYDTSIIKRGILWQSTQKLTDRAFFFKFLHTSLPFSDILSYENSNNIPLRELNIAWVPEGLHAKTVTIGNLY